MGNPLEGHTDWVTDVAFSPDGALIASASNDQTLRLWDPSSGSQVGDTLEGHTDWIDGVAFSTDGSLLASAGRDGTRLWDAATGEPVVDPLEGEAQWITDVAFSPDGTGLATTSWSTIRQWDALWDPNQACELAGPYVRRVQIERHLPEGTDVRTCTDIE